MLEPGDVDVNFLAIGTIQGPEPSDFLKGIPRFQSRYDELQRKDVGDTYEETIRMEGKRDIKIVFAEQNPHHTSSWKKLKEFTLDGGTAGFRISVEVQRRHNKGRHNFRYTATNSRGKAIWEKVLFINQEACECVIN